MKFVNRTSTPTGKEEIEYVEIPDKVLSFVTEPTAKDKYPHGRQFVHITNPEYAKTVGRRVRPLSKLKSDATQWSFEVMVCEE
jgi:hypothetical protein